MGYGAAAHVSFVYMLYHMDVIRVPKEETFSKKHTAEEVRLLTIVAYFYTFFWFDMKFSSSVTKGYEELLFQIQITRTV